MKRHPRGFLLVIVLMVMLTLGTLATFTTELMRPTGKLMDIRQDAVRLQMVLDSALEAALLDINADKEPTPKRVIKNAGIAFDITSKTVPIEIPNMTNLKTVIIHVAGQTAPLTQSKPQVVDIQVNILKKDGQWRVFAYDLQDPDNGSR